MTHSATTDGAHASMRVLVADDDPVTRRLVEASLTTWGYSVELAQNGSDAWNALARSDGPSLAVLDWVMPGLEGPELCRRIRALGDRYVYVLLLTAKAEKRALLEAFDAGADDYVVKPFELEELHARVRSGKRILRLEQELRVRATHDVLTGLWSRRAVLEMLASELDRGRRSSSTVSLMMLDLDRFKAINDAHGHLAGDAVLEAVSYRVKKAVRAYDIVGRYGGEEILIVLPQCEPAAARAIAERTLAALSENPVRFGNVFVPVTASIGVATSHRAPETAPSALIQLADEALYRAKAAGRNRVELA
ncbi:MAG: diguanylate cyclase [Myxococcota bacterium]|nr:diguanylate cyclase [Myxococcota bacterium]